MRDDTPDSIRETASPMVKHGQSPICEAGSLINDPQSGFTNPNFNIIVNLHPTEGTN